MFVRTATLPVLTANSESEPNMNAPNLDALQSEGLLDLLILGMYADGHLAISEDERMHEFLKQQGATNVEDRLRLIGEGVTRVGRHAGNDVTRPQYVAHLAGRFTRSAEKNLALAVLERLLCVDETFATREERFWNEVKAVFER